MLAGNAYFELSGGRVDAVAVAFGVCAAVMAVVQLALVGALPPHRLRAGGLGVRLRLQRHGRARAAVDRAHPAARRELLAALVLVAIAGLVAVIAVRTVIGLVRGTFLSATSGP